MNKTFEDFLREEHHKLNPDILDDDLPDSFVDWVSNLETDYIIGYAEEWGKQIQDYADMVIQKIKEE